jgi:hypothetical protein
MLSVSDPTNGVRVDGEQGSVMMYFPCSSWTHLVNNHDTNEEGQFHTTKTGLYGSLIRFDPYIPTCRKVVLPAKPFAGSSRYLSAGILDWKCGILYFPSVTPSASGRVDQIKCCSVDAIFDAACTIFSQLYI